MALFFKRLAKAGPVAFTNAFGGQPKSGARNFRIPFGAIAAVSGGISFYCFSSENLVDAKNENFGLFGVMDLLKLM
ncbi:NADH-cytochrome b5 reductase-like protein [Vitis vinifera]|uniref:NADH-cytochrome b5 reductase-like protein n=1 Tax=Vitis vinifera TaxID=29760 RepID=A0A438EIG1_VITVI|nr:NADH-cytochrome b5 reductase-like protein [Vitis vinifera]